MLPSEEKIMTLNHCLSALLFFLLMGLAASNFISDSVFESRGSTGRNLLQAPKNCAVDFESANYTIITSQCKAPQYLPKLCCPAFKQFACLYVGEINDLTTNCATIMFSYIQRHGFPAGLFSNTCVEGKEGITCNNATAPAKSEDASGSWVAQTLSPLLMLTAVFQVLLLIL